ncbi:MAG: aminotransferase class V-fold PLP-dependent enzyme [Pseudomonadota bacterium]
MSTEIYLDANATSAVLPAAIAAADAAMRAGFGNPSSTHATGLQAKAMLDGVRACARRVLGVGNGRLVFTSGATEGIQTAVLSALCAIRERQLRGEPTGSLLLYGATEHKAVPEALAHWNRILGTGLVLCALPVDRAGQHRLDMLRELAPQAALVCTMAANNETGAVSDLAGIEAILRDSPAYWMVDSVQALGKIALDLAATRIDYAPFSGHKLYAPKGVGMLYVRDGAPYTPLMAGGGQEGGARAGTENMSGIAALGAVLEALEQGGLFRTHDELVAMRERLADALRAVFPGIVFNSPFATSLPTTLNFSVPGFASKELLDLFDAANVRVSSGSACSSAKAAPSYVLEAMCAPAWACAAAVRMSFGPLATMAFIDAACQRIAHCGAALRASCLIPSDTPMASHDGVIQLGSDGANTWIVADAASRSCVLIDMHEQHEERVASYVRCQGYAVRARLSTCDVQGWPEGSMQVALGNGTQAAAIAMGENVLARLAPDDIFMGVSYLFGRCGGAGLASGEVRFAFTGGQVLPGGVCVSLPLAQLRHGVQRLAALVHADTILCPARDDKNQVCSSIGAEGRGAGVLAELLAMQPRLARPALPAMDSMMHLAPDGLERFLASHPDAVLVDVREAFEHAAATAPEWGGQRALSVPLSRLASHLPQWLAGPQRPLVFFCRTGNRSARAAQCLHRLGYQNAWSVIGGMALGGAALALAA